jgi:hypothetical protein
MLNRGVLRAVVVALVLLTLVPTASRAQGGSIAGVVRDATGAVLPGVTVEASGPALIDKRRSVFTDDQGLYRIVDVPSGTYTVTFSLSGFAPARHEALEISSNFTATVNGELRVGAVMEMVTVSARPGVDVQNLLQQRVISTSVLDALPSAKSIQSLAALIPGMTVGPSNHDVGGTVGDQPAGAAIHGGRADDQHIYYDGMRTNNVNTIGTAGGGAQSIFFNPAAIHEITVAVGNLGIESETGGVAINVIPKSGGNLFSGSFIANGANGSLQSNNLTDKLRARGLDTVTTIKGIWDINGGLGGPVKRDAIWFHTAYRRWGNESYVAGRYFNATPLAWTYTPDLTRPAYEQNMHRSINGRLTWQVNTRNRLTFSLERQAQCICYTGIGSYASYNTFGAVNFTSPEATTRADVSPSTYLQTRWTSTLGARLLVEAGLSRNTMNWHEEPQPGVGADVISVTELSTNFTYRAPALYTGLDPDDAYNAETYYATFAASYVTGAHTFKVGTTVLHGRPYTDFQVNRDMTYQFLDGVPQAVILRATPLKYGNRLKAEFGLYAHDQWTISRMTLNLGLRYSYLNAFVPAQNLPAGTFVPERSYPAIPGVAVWHDLTPRIGASFDLFGTGRTALKLGLSKYLGGQGAGAAQARNPQNTVVDTAYRGWTDADGDYIPTCDLLNPDANGECEPLSNRNFGRAGLVSTTFDPDVLHGYGKRYYNGEASIGIQHEPWPRISASAAYFRRWYGNFLVNDNRAVQPSDYDPFCITTPADSRLPGGGHQICGFYDIKPALFGRVDNFVTFAKNYGEASDVYDGIDLTVTARLPRGAMVQGGVNIGREVTDLCDVVGKVDLPAASLPFFTSDLATGLLPSLSGLASPSTMFCRVSPPFQTELKLSAAYPLPWGMQVSATIQSIPGAPIVATSVVSSSQIAASLGRDLAAGPAATATIPLVAPGTMYGDRLNQVDVRLSKSIRLGRATLRAIADTYNLLNVSPVLNLNQRYGPAWQQPFIILPGRFAKLGVQIEF